MLPPDYSPPILGNPKLLVTCPECGHESREHYEHLKAGPRLDCSACTVAFTCDGEKLDEGLGSIGNPREAVSKSLKILDPGSQPGAFDDSMPGET